jgi:hypothetical protein
MKNDTKAAKALTQWMNRNNVRVTDDFGNTLDYSILDFTDNTDEMAGALMYFDIKIQGLMPPAMFRIDSAAGPRFYEGYYNEETWNGWEVPYFTKEVAERIVSDLRDSGDEAIENASIDWECNMLIINDDEDMMQEFSSLTAEKDGQEVPVYSIGGRCWCWELVDDNSK